MKLGLGMRLSTERLSSGVVLTPVNTVLPEVLYSIPVHPGDAVSVSDGTWTSPTEIISYTYQWFLDGAEITGETSATYQVSEPIYGLILTCAVTATNDAGSTTIMSNPWIVDYLQYVTTSCIIELDVSNIPTINTHAVFEQAGSIAYQWFRNGVAESTETSAVYAGPTANEDSFYLETYCINGYSYVADTSNTVIIPPM